MNEERESLWQRATADTFIEGALSLFAYQALNNPIYRRYCELSRGRDIERVIATVKRSDDPLRDIPYLPIELFKSGKVYCDDGCVAEAEAIFTSSGDVSSRHYMHSLSHYVDICEAAFRGAYGDGEMGLYALLPSYLEREGSSLIYMVEALIERFGGGGFYLYDHEALLADMAADPRPKILLGVSYALLDLAESGLVTEPLRDTIVMETGGMKGRREELTKEELHRRLCSVFGVDVIHSEYGMAELTSQAYSKGEGLFYPPSWMRVLIRDVADPFDVVSVGRGERGGVNIIDLASVYSCAFIATQDMGVSYADGGFRLEGRISGSDIRGCNLLI